jgi:hypothetical protein
LEAVGAFVFGARRLMHGEVPRGQNQANGLLFGSRRRVARVREDKYK